MLYVCYPFVIPSFCYPFAIRSGFLTSDRQSVQELWVIRNNCSQHIAMRENSHFFWLVIFQTTISSPQVLARERWQINEKFLEKNHNFSWTSCRVDQFQIRIDLQKMRSPYLAEVLFAKFGNPFLSYRVSLKDKNSKYSLLFYLLNHDWVEQE